MSLVTSVGVGMGGGGSLHGNTLILCLFFLWDKKKVESLMVPGSDVRGIK